MDDCRHPAHIAATAYRRGCRCERCVRFAGQRDASRGYYPRERVANTITRWLHDTGHTQRDLAELTGLAERDIYRILNGPSDTELEKGRATGKHVKLSTLDRLLCKLDMVHLFLLPPDQGGYADLYLLEPLEAAA